MSRRVAGLAFAFSSRITNFHLCRDWYSRELEKTFTIGDVTIHTTAADHQTWLRLAVTCFEVVCGKGKDAFTIFHSGDCYGTITRRWHVVQVGESRQGRACRGRGLRRNGTLVLDAGYEACLDRVPVPAKPVWRHFREIGPFVLCFHAHSIA
ncbi:MAG: hypothetical protein IKL96_12190 [Kiritimatiellae bacterium]|nr:hypothetical protein [Kiritimatiellia bacterium]